MVTVSQKLRIGYTPSVHYTLNAAQGSFTLTGEADTFGTTTSGLPTPTFTYFVSPTGSSSNPGTLASPWDLNSLNTKASTYAGKGVGLLPGTYSLVSLGINQNLSSYQNGALVVPCGSSAGNTVIGSCDNNGNYSIGSAIIDCGSTTSNNPNGSFILGNMGNQNATGPNGSIGYITVAGIEFKNAIANFLILGPSEALTVPSTYWKGCIIQDCYFHDAFDAFAGTSTNFAAFQFFGCDGLITQNNFFTRIYTNATNPRVNPFVGWASINCLHQWNTIYADPITQGPFGGILHKAQNQYNNKAKWNFVHLANAKQLGSGCICLDSTGSSSNTENFDRNICVAPPGGAWINNADLGDQQHASNRVISGNTFVQTASSGSSTVQFTQASFLGITHYNNVYLRTGTHNSRGDLDFSVDGVALCDYDWFPSSPFLGLTASGTTNYPTLYNLANFRTNLTPGCIGKEANCVNLTSNVTPTIANASGTGLLATDYQLPGTYGNSGSSAGASAGSSTGQSGGTAVNVGAWDGVVKQIGCSFRNPS